MAVHPESSAGAFHFPLSVWDTQGDTYEPVASIHRDFEALPSYAVMAGNFNAAAVAWRGENEIVINENRRQFGRFHHELSIWNAFTGETIETLMTDTVVPRGHGSQFDELALYAYSADYSMMLRYGIPGELPELFVLPDFTHLGFMDIQEEWIRFAALSPNSPFILTEHHPDEGLSVFTIWHYLPAQGINRVYELRGDRFGAWHPDGFSFALMHGNGLDIYAVSNGKRTQSYAITSPQAVFWSPRQNYIAVLHTNGLSIIDHEREMIVLHYEGEFQTLAWQASEQELAVYTSKGFIERIALALP